MRIFLLRGRRLGPISGLLSARDVANSDVAEAMGGSGAIFCGSGHCSMPLNACEPGNLGAITVRVGRSAGSRGQLVVEGRPSKRVLTGRPLRASANGLVGGGGRKHSHSGNVRDCGRAITRRFGSLRLTSQCVSVLVRGCPHCGESRLTILRGTTLRCPAIVSRTLRGYVSRRLVDTGSFASITGCLTTPQGRAPPIPPMRTIQSSYTSVGIRARPVDACARVLKNTTS